MVCHCLQAVTKGEVNTAPLLRRTSPHAMQGALNKMRKPGLADVRVRVGKESKNKHCYFILILKNPIKAQGKNMNIEHSRM